MMKVDIFRASLPAHRGHRQHATATGFVGHQMGPDVIVEERSRQPAVVKHEQPVLHQSFEVTQLAGVAVEIDHLLYFEVRLQRGSQSVRHEVLVMLALHRFVGVRDGQQQSASVRNVGGQAIDEPLDLGRWYVFKNLNQCHSVETALAVS